jgi:hypothetical protein
MHWHEAGFVKVNEETGSGREIVENCTKAGHRSHISPAKNQCIVCVLQDWRGEAKIKGVGDRLSSPSFVH